MPGPRSHSCRRGLRSALLPLLLRALGPSAALAAPQDGGAPTSLLCGLELHHGLRPATAATGPEDGGDHDFVACRPVGTDGRVTHHMYTFAHQDGLVRLWQSVQPRLRRGEELFLNLSQAVLRQSELHLPEHAQPELLNRSSVPKVAHRALVKAPAYTGTLRNLVLRVSAPDAAPTPTADELAYWLWGAGDRSLQGQLLACSVGQLRIEPTQYGVMEVRVGLAAWNRPYVDLVNAAYDAALADLLAADADLRTAGIDNVRDLADLVMLVLPPGTVNVGSSSSAARLAADADWAAFGAIPGQQSVFNDEWATYLGAVAHEYGHNLGLFHSWEGGVDYGDITGFMGAALKQTGYPKRCYNGQNHWHLGWYKGHTAPIGATALATPGVYSVAAFVDSQLADASQYVVLQIASYGMYLQYNRAKSYNVETGEYPDKLVIVQEISESTNLVASLDMTDRQLIVDPLVIEVCGVYEGVEGVSPDYMTVSIGLGSSACPGSTITSTASQESTDPQSSLSDYSDSHSFHFPSMPKHFFVVIIGFILVLILVVFVWCRRRRQNDTKNTITKPRSHAAAHQPIARHFTAHSPGADTTFHWRGSDSSDASSVGSISSQDLWDPRCGFEATFYDEEVSSVPRRGFR